MDTERQFLPKAQLLVIDDNRDAADSLAMCLRLERFAVRVAYAGPDALALLNTELPDAAIIDLAMPGMDGCAVARRARELPGGRDVTLICMTAHSDEENRERIRQAGFDHCLYKPADVEDLLQLLAGSAGRDESSSFT
jgi:CheY-like chemotaxis protein